MAEPASVTSFMLVRRKCWRFRGLSNKQVFFFENKFNDHVRTIFRRESNVVFGTWDRIHIKYLHLLKPHFGAAYLQKRSFRNPYRGYPRMYGVFATMENWKEVVFLTARRFLKNISGNLWTSKKYLESILPALNQIVFSRCLDVIWSLFL